MVGFLVRGRVRIKIRIRVRIGVMFNVRVYHWSNCRRSKCCTFAPPRIPGYAITHVAFPGQGLNADLSKGIEDAQRCSHACSQDVGEEEIDAPALHLASLADSDGRQGRDESYQDGQQNDQDRQPHPCITLVTDKREIIMIKIT